MKKKIYIVIAILVVGFLAYFIYGVLTTRSHSPSETKAFSHAGLDVKVVYSRPYKKGRLIFGDEKDEALVPTENIGGSEPMRQLKLPSANQ